MQRRQTATAFRRARWYARGVVCVFAAQMVFAAAPAMMAQDATHPASSELPEAPAPSAPERTSLSQAPALQSPPLAIVPLDASIPGAAVSVGGSMQAWNGRAFITTNGEITAGTQTAQVTLPYRGTLNICPSTTVKLSADTNVPASEVPGLLIALDGGSLEANFTIGKNADVVMTPGLRILISGPGNAEVRVRLGEDGDTCVDNSGAGAPYVAVTSLFDSGLYRVQPGQRVLFQHGSLQSVIDQEPEPCGCPPASKRANEFPLAQSQGVAQGFNPPTLSATDLPAGSGQASTTLVHNPGGPATKKVAIPAPPPAPVVTRGPNPNEAAKAVPKKPGFFRKVGRFFKRVFGAESAGQ